VTDDPERLAALDAAWKDSESWPRLGPVDYHVPLYAKYLEGLRICLDPGHGGDAHLEGYKRGPTAFREALMNLGVAEYLKEFLEEAGAEVLLTRTADVEVGLAERARIANDWGADIFISIHHNAAADPSVNRTTVWFHGEPGDRPSSLDLARYLQQGLADALRLPQVDGNPLKSDYLMYPGAGFGVLRRARMTAALTEASFFTNPYEEYRLSKDWYWKREAYGLFLGLARYAWAGIPKPELVSPEPGSRTPEKRPEIKLRTRTGLEERGSWADDRSWIMEDSIRVTIDGRKTRAEFDETEGIVKVRPREPLAAGEHTVLAGYRNYNGNFAHPVPFTFVVDPPPAGLDIATEPPALPPDPRALARVRVRVRDEDGEPVLDGTRVAIGASAGACEPRRGTTRDGEFLSYYTPPEQPIQARLIAVSGGYFGAGGAEAAGLPESSMAAFFVSDSSTEEPLPGVRCTVSIGDATREMKTDVDGWSLKILDMAGESRAEFWKNGYHEESIDLTLRFGEARRAAVSLRPVLGGVLHGKTILLDARFGGGETGDTSKDGSTAAKWNLELARALAERLETAGAEPVLVREGDETVPPVERVKRANRHPDADLYLRLGHGLSSEAPPVLSVGIYPGSERGGKIAAAIIEQASVGPRIETSAVKGVDDVEIHKTRMLAVGVRFRTLDHPGFSGREHSVLVREEADCVLLGLARYFGWAHR
jgi:N-acetylmuramoyl-L-alanine amidase